MQAIKVLEYKTLKRSFMKKEFISTLLLEGVYKNAPEALNIDELDNPLVIIYHFR